MVKSAKSYTLVITGFFFIAFFLAAGVVEILRTTPYRNQTANPLINVSELSEEFMIQYRDDYSQMVKQNQPENIIIVSSSTEIENTFGATMVVRAANHQYFLQYQSKTEKENAIKWLKNDPSLVVSENVPHHYSEVSDGSSYSSWGIEKMGLDHMKDVIADYPGKSDITVAIVDSGLDMERFRENFPNKLIETYNSADPSADMSDSVGHGTHIAGTIAEGTPDNVKILSVKTSEDASVYTSDIIASIDFITYYKKADVINMSFSSSVYSDAEYLSIEAARQKNIISVAAAGNGATSTKEYPAAFDNTISVSAVDESLELANFSNFGSTITFVAPGVDIKSIGGIDSGTSMAAPHLASAVAVARSLKNDLDYNETISFLQTRTIDLGATGRDARYGYGFVDFNGAKLCGTNPSEQCDDFAILEKPTESGIEITDIILTPYNYGSLTNILATKFRILNSDGTYVEKALGDLGANIEITGYNPYTTEEQQVTVKYNSFTASFVMRNPEDYPSGWLYEEVYDYGNSSESSQNIALVDYRDHGLNIKTLYLPETIDSKLVTRTSRTCPFFAAGKFTDTCYGSTSNDAKYYETIIMPTSIRSTSGFSGDSFRNLTEVISLASELEVTGGAFANLRALAKVDANILFGKFEVLIGGSIQTEYAQGVFSGSESLESIELSDNNTIIPDDTFSQCGNLSVVTIPDSIEKIGTNAFSRAGISVIELSENLKSIDENAFAFSALESLTIPSSTTEIAPSAFSGLALESLSVATGNPVYDSRDSSNAIILTAEDKLLVGTVSTSIPNSVKTISSGAFMSLDTLSEVIIPEGVEVIEAGAVSNCNYLTKAVLPRSLITIEDDSFSFNGLGTPSKTVFWVYDTSYALERVIELDVPYVIIDPTESSSLTIINTSYESIPPHRIYHAFETFSPDNFVIKVFYYDEEADAMVEEPEIIANYEVKYFDQNGMEHDTLSGGMNFVTFTFDTVEGFQNIKLDMEIIVWRLDPEYEVPSNISAHSGQYLSEVALPDGFSWINEDEAIDSSVSEYYAIYTPEDSQNYKTMKYIPINIQIVSDDSFVEAFPDEGLRACIVETINTQSGTTYTDDIIPLDEVLSLEHLSCPYNDGQEAISDARGIEKLTKLKTLDLSGHDIEKINLSSNAKLTELNLRDNPIRNLDISKNPELAVFLVNEDRLLDGERLTVKTAAYVEIAQKNDEVSAVEIDVSELKFMVENDFTFDATPRIEGIYSDGIIELSQCFDDKIRIRIPQNDNTESSFDLDLSFRKIIVSVYLDGILFDIDMFATAYTGATIDLDDIAYWTSLNYGISSNYDLENASVLSTNNYTVGTSDVNLSLYYVKKTQNSHSNNGDDSGDSGSGDNHGDGESNHNNTNGDSNGLDNESSTTGDGASDDNNTHITTSDTSAVSKVDTPASGPKKPNTGAYANNHSLGVSRAFPILTGLLVSVLLIITGFRTPSTCHGDDKRANPR